MGRLLQRLINQYHWSNRIKITKLSHFLCKGELRRCHVLVKGSSNKITIGDESQVHNIDLVVTGDDNELIVGDSCYLESNMLVQKRYMYD